MNGYWYKGEELFIQLPYSIKDSKSQNIGVGKIKRTIWGPKFESPASTYPQSLSRSVWAQVTESTPCFSWIIHLTFEHRSYWSQDREQTCNDIDSQGHSKEQWCMTNQLKLMILMIMYLRTAILSKGFFVGKNLENNCFINLKNLWLSPLPLLPNPPKSSYCRRKSLWKIAHILMGRMFLFASGNNDKWY